MSAKSERLRGRLTINPDEIPAPAPAPTPAPQPVASQPVVLPAPEPVAEAEPEPIQQPEVASDTAVTPLQPRERSVPAKRARTPSSPPAATERPPEGRSDYRSFYVSDEVYFRFRAAIFWSSRNPKAAGKVPDNMSAAVEQWMLELATDLEGRYNDGEAFPQPPAPRRRRRKADS